MPARIKTFAVICCLLPWLAVLAVALHSYASKRAPVTRAALIAQRSSTERAQNIMIVIDGIAEIGAVILLIDAFRREYEGPKLWAIVTAIFGVFSCGLASIIYYAMWGRDPARPEVPIADDFCETCHAQTRDKESGPVFAFNLIGTRFLGRANRCHTCGSTIRTVWICFLLPLIPVGSYRVLPVGKAMVHKASFRSRKAPLYMTNVAAVYAVVAVVVAFFLWMAH